MAKARAIVKRRRAAQNIKRITRTMQLIASSRWPRALKRAQAGKPYAEKLSEMVATLADQSVEHPLLKANAEARKALLLTITANRGLCGAYNASVLRAATDHARLLTGQGIEITYEMVGKKGVNFARFMRLPVASSITDIEDKIAYARVAGIAERYMQAYAAGELARVDVAYMRFHSVGVQRPAVIKLLPIEPPAPGEAADAARHETLFEFSPAPEVLLARLIPETVKIRLYQCFNEAIVSEQVARMVAMKSATDAAGDMIKYLTRDYNRARQSQITMELADIVGGAEAVK